MGANQVLGIAQALYETHKVTTYPRTDCGYLPVSMRGEVPAVMAALVKTDPAIAPVVATLDQAFVSRIWNDKKITAHHAIIPTRQACDMAALSEEERKVYQLIRQHYLAQFLPLQETDITDATFNIGGQLFRTRGRVEVVPGWRVLFAADKAQPGDTPARVESVCCLPGHRG
ncbi:DNA topoisomerase 3 [Cedecea neteri]|uniref:DNA topoisomerase 3 n=1 Tax=Cedecea neteri TaxID=158822 RepID=A0A2X2T7L6_9ENTR|nr:DNA topoisomerase 3 [Cedecea neteri]